MTNQIKTMLLPLYLLLLLSGCGGTTAETVVPEEQAVITDFPAGLAVPDQRYTDSYQILIYGNSHVRSHNLSGLIQQLIELGRPGVKVNVVVAPGGAFLDERLSNDEGLRLLQSKAWTHVILQGQKYSTSGLYSYPIDDSLIWLRAVKAQQATPILFPEHGQYGNITEGERVHLLHQSIVAAEPGCIAPVGLAWNKVSPQDPQIRLHEADGNHAALAGTFLTALVFYQSITGNNAELLAFVPQIALSSEQQQFLRQIAAATLQQDPACVF